MQNLIYRTKERRKRILEGESWRLGIMLFNTCILFRPLHKDVQKQDATNFTEATSRITHLEKTGKFFQVCHSQSVLISLSRNHPCLVLIYYYFFGVFLPKKTIIWRFPLMRKQFCQIRKK